VQGQPRREIGDVRVGTLTDTMLDTTFKRENESMKRRGVRVGGRGHLVRNWCKGYGTAETPICIGQKNALVCNFIV
jgi:hypothetical protein